MKRTLAASRSLTIFTSAAVLAFATTSGATDWVEKSDEYTTVILKAQSEFQPEGASGLGLTEFDDQISDLGPNLFERTTAVDRELIALTEQWLQTAENPKVIQDLNILQQALQDGIESAALNNEYMLPYYNLPQTLFFGFRALLDPRTDPARYPAALQRLAKYTGRAEGYEPITELAKARTSERFDQPGLLGPYQGQLERDLGNVERFSGGLKQLFEASGLEGYEQDLDLLIEQLNGYAEWLKTEMMPRARQDHRLPAEVYADNLKNFGVRDTPEQLIRAAQFGFQEIKSQMRSLARQIAAQRGWENGELMHVMKELKKEQIPEDKILEVYMDRLAAIEAMIVEHDIITLPDRDASIRLATEAESSAIPAPFMSPPQLIGNTGQYGEFVLVQKNPSMGEDSQMDDWNHDSVTWALTVHEARPGHEMQFAALVENGTSLARTTYAFNSANVEGWGLYSEAIMMEHLPLEGQLFTLLARLQRAGRMFMDPMVNLGLMSPEEVTDFMVNQIGLSKAMASSEADRYAFLAPGQATSYYYGYRNLQRLRTEVEMTLGDRFNQRKYHDFILEQGLLPPELLRQAVLEDFVPAQ
ncbi:MAG: hypothetical protein DHS20C11_29140 [Lysobacteraceae bacterium]|nr:MAG: hypothetical protein DHS20C11_29140 [Xanthomonadaceae bacterium]